MHIFNLIFTTLLFSLTAQAGELYIEFERPLTQGAMVTGHTNATVFNLDDREIDLDDKGRFVFGLGRDTKNQVSVALVGVDGVSLTSNYPVTQREYKIQKITGVAQKYVSPPASVSERIKREAREVKEARRVNRTDGYDYLEAVQWPAKGPITGVYGSQRVFNGVPKRPHYGLDIAGPVGHPVYAPLPGKVTFANDDLYYSGGTLIIDHGRGISSTFIHLSKIHVQVGEDVKQGQLIAGIGATGRVTGPHLDWRMNWFDVRLDPQLLLPDRDLPAKD